MGETKSARYVCKIKTLDGKYKVTRFSNQVKITKAFLLTRFSLGYICMDEKAAMDAVQELREKEAAEFGLQVEDIKLIEREVDKPLDQLCETDKKGQIIRYVDALGEWKVVDIKLLRTLKKAVPPTLYDIPLLEKLRLEAFLKIPQDAAEIDFFMMGKAQGLSELMELSALEWRIETEKNLIEEEVNLADDELYGLDIQYHKGVVAGYEELKVIIENTPLFNDYENYNYIVLIPPTDHFWVYTQWQKNRWFCHMVTKTISINIFVSDSFEAAMAEKDKTSTSIEICALRTKFPKGAEVDQIKSANAFFSDLLAAGIDLSILKWNYSPVQNNSGDSNVDAKLLKILEKQVLSNFSLTALTPKEKEKNSTH